MLSRRIEQGFEPEEQIPHTPPVLIPHNRAYREYLDQIQVFTQEQEQLIEHFRFDRMDPTAESAAALATGLATAGILRVDRAHGTIELNSRINRLRPGDVIPGPNGRDQHVHSRDLQVLEPILSNATRIEQAPTPELPGTPEQRAELLTQKWMRCLENQDWQAALALLAQAETDTLLWEQTRVAQELHESLFVISNQSFWDTHSGGTVQVDAMVSVNCMEIENIAAQIVRAMKFNPNLADYATSIIVDQKIPPLVEDALWKNRIGGDSVDIATFAYYEYVVEALWGMGRPDTASRLKRIFSSLEIETQRRIEARELYQQELYEEHEKESTQTRAPYITKYEAATTEAEREAILQEFYNEYWTQLFPEDYEPTTDEEYWYNENSSSPWNKDEYYGIRLKNLLLEAIGDTGSKTDAPYVVHLMAKQREIAPFLERNAAQALSQLDIGESAQDLRLLIQGDDIVLKRIGLSLLFQLEGQMEQINNGVARYLDKIIDLGSPDFDGGHIQRITSNGHIGIFDPASKRLQGYFTIEQLDSDAASVRVDYLEFTYRALYTPRANETAAEKTDREQLLQEFQYKFHDFFHGEFFKKIPGVRFQDLTLREQAQFLLTYDKMSQEDREQLKVYAEIFGLEGFNTLLSLRHKPELCKALISLSSSEHREQARQVLRAYSTLVRNAEITEQLLHVNFGKTDGYPEGIYETLEEQILSRAADALKQYIQAINQNNTITARGILADIALLDSRINFLTTAYRTQRRLGLDVELKDVVGFEQLILSGKQLQEQHPELSVELKRIYRTNFERIYVHKPGVDKEQGQKFVEELLAAFQVALYQSGNRFYVYLDTKKIDPNTGKATVVAFCRFDEQTDSDGTPSLHAASANTNPQYKNGDMGLGTLSEAFTAEKTRGIPITAECDPSNPATQFYVEDLEFIATGYHEINGQPSLDIRIDPSLRASLASTTWDSRYIELLSLSSRSKHANWEITTQPNFTLLNQGYHLTRICTGEDGQKYYVFERLETAAAAQAA